MNQPDRPVLWMIVATALSLSVGWGIRGNFGPSGEVLWQQPVEKPTSVQRLDNGDTLTASTTTGQVIEFTRTGRRVWQVQAAHRGLARPLVARRFGG